MAHPMARDEHGMSTLLSFVVLLVVIALALAAYYALLPKPGPLPLLAQDGDDVKVDYIGYFQDTDRVFDTSLESVATDNATWPKAFSFAWRASWTSLSFTIGQGTVVRGFDFGVRGLTIGEAKTIVVPPAEGYGPADPSKIMVKPLVESVPVQETMNQTAFTAKYHTNAVSGEVVMDPFWGWPTVVIVAGDIVTVTNEPVLGEVVQPYGAWQARVACVDDAVNGCAGQIIVQHVLDSSAVDRIGGKTSDGRTFVITAVDVSAGTYTMNFNSETVGRTLVFQVTMVSISRL